MTEDQLEVRKAELSLLDILKQAEEIIEQEIKAIEKEAYDLGVREGKVEVAQQIINKLRLSPTNRPVDLEIIQQVGELKKGE